MKSFIVISLLLPFLLSGCIKDIKAWEKGTLAKATMQESGTNHLTKSYEEHVYFSKEATKGGSGIGGGGCGCN